MSHLFRYQPSQMALGEMAFWVLVEKMLYVERRLFLGNHDLPLHLV
jgi:hypothetical protein